MALSIAVICFPKDDTIVSVAANMILGFSPLEKPRVGLQYTVNFDRQNKVAKAGTPYTGFAVEVFVGPSATTQAANMVTNAAHNAKAREIRRRMSAGDEKLYADLRAGKSVSEIMRSTYSNPVPPVLQNTQTACNRLGVSRYQMAARHAMRTLFTAEELAASCVTGDDSPNGRPALDPTKVEFVRNFVSFWIEKKLPGLCVKKGAVTKAMGSTCSSHRAKPRNHSQKRARSNEDSAGEL